MSKTRFDRRRGNSQPEQWDSDYAKLTGGMDLSSSALSIKPGRMVGGINVEEIFGQQGYSFIRGYERFDGRLRPSQADYAIQPFDNGTALISAGETVTNASAATGLVVEVTLTGGSWVAGTAAGILLLTDVTSGWANNDPIRVSGVQRAQASDITEEGSVGYANHEDALTTVREYLRALIQKPAGSGAILGGAVFNDRVYCVRNAADGLSATLWKSSSSGWVSVKTGLHAGGAYRFEACNFSGAADRLALYGVSGHTRLFEVQADDTVTFAAPIWGSEALSTSNVTIGLGAKTFTSATASRDWQSGDILTVWRQGNTQFSMTGAVTAYNSGTGQMDLNVTSIVGTGTFNAWEIGRADYSDKPYLLAEHKDHLFLAYPNGQLQSSNLGEPLVATTTAALFGLGQEITGLVSLKGEAMAIFCESKTDVLRGSSALDWAKGKYSERSGAVIDTVAENDGNAIYLGSNGLTSLMAVQAFGDFEAGIFSRDTKKRLDALRGTEVGARMAANNYQYRLYFEDGTNLRYTIMTGASTFSAKDVSASLSTYDTTPTCLFSGKINGEERMFFGDDAGWLMEEDVGTSFDGEDIYYGVLLPFNHYKTPAADKQFHKLELELICPDALTINFRQLFDYEDGTFDFGSGSTDMPGEGGQFDVSALDEFAFDLPRISRSESSVDGIARNMALLLWAESGFVRPATLQGVLTYFTVLGVRR